MNDTFEPPFYLKSSLVQTFFASNKFRLKGKRNKMVENEESIVFDVHNKIKLLGFYSKQKDAESKGLVILIHGWEGSSNSTYVKSTGGFLYDNGYSLFRINLRDHGESHHLNNDFFYAILLDEVYDAIRKASEIEENKPSFLMGFSLGGNFALRSALKFKNDPINNLKHVIAVSPGLDPETSTDKIDNNHLLKKYFLKKWKRSLSKKEKLFPEIFDFKEILKIDTCRELTNQLLTQFSIYDDMIEYFKGYTLLDSSLKDIAVPTTIITSADDPIISVDDFYNLKLNDLTELIVLKYGGHNGFLKRIFSPTWYEEKALEIFNKSAN